nr:MAG TPA: hypothetical protein [Caudoviricetes sp.]
MPGQLEISRCRKPVCTVSLKRTTTGQRAALCAGAAGPVEIKSRHRVAARGRPIARLCVLLVDEVEIDLARVRLGVAARDTQADEGERNRRGENPLGLAVLDCVGCGVLGHPTLLPVRRRGNSLRLTLLLVS